MKKKKYVKPEVDVVDIEFQGIIAASSKFIGVSDEEADSEMEVLSKGRGGRSHEEENSWGNLW
ncbi:MAG: hypothetical protein LUD00_05490 [Prevotellaceae bacterium]|nr:hypothetical protein [Prevotellaceae bacterium]